jgi:hypothetical protein
MPATKVIIPVIVGKNDKPKIAKLTLKKQTEYCVPEHSVVPGRAIVTI